LKTCAGIAGLQEPLGRFLGRCSIAVFEAEEGKQFAKLARLARFPVSKVTSIFWVQKRIIQMNFAYVEPFEKSAGFEPGGAPSRGLVSTGESGRQNPFHQQMAKTIFGG
jgi:hypothetical protein